MYTVGGQEGGGFDGIQETVDPSARERLAADGVNAPVRPHSACLLHQAVVNIFVIEVDRFGTAFSCGHLQAFGNVVDGNYAFGAEHTCAFHRELPDRAAAPNGDGVAL